MAEQPVRIAPSLLSADFFCLERDIREMERAEADLLHIDVMDGHFVPNITIGPLVVQCLKKQTKLPLDVHLMITDPLFFLEAFLDAGADMITVHRETCSDEQIRHAAESVRARGVLLGVSINPATPLQALRSVLDVADMILMMSVNPGFGGQPFIAAVLPKMRELRAAYTKDISIDGGINAQTAGLARAAGATILVAGSYIFGAQDKRAAVRSLRQCSG
ncbi:MAG: ribulose-phosphate 3-epimerase [Candidatus Omnitrophica bacterium]|nr:ribulose-phosphate 3-epimerase [Candidatus Omnitrophota bacterium]